MRSSVWNYLVFPFLLLTEFRDIALSPEFQGCFSCASAAPAAPNEAPDPMNYLRSYGYLPRSDLESHEMSSMGEFQSAVCRFQKMSGLRETGQIDRRTLEMMRKARCGRPDVAAPQEFKIGPSHWEKRDLTYRILSYTGDLNPNSVDKAFDEAFRVWSSATPLVFRKVYSGEADILMSFSTLYHADGYPFDGKGGVLAHAFPPGDERGGDVHFDDDENWTAYSEEGTNLLIVAAHEIGHSLGLSHSQDQDSLMYPVYQGYKRGHRLSSDDTQGIQSIYGSRSHPRLTTDKWKATTVWLRPKFGATTRRRVTVTSPSTRSRAEDVPPHLCSADLDAVASIRGEIFAFHRKWFWRLRRDDSKPVDAYLITSFWRGFPYSVDRIDAAFESPANGRIFFFSGNNYWEFETNQLAPGFSSSGRKLSYLGIPPSVERIDAAFVWERNHQIYVISGDIYWGIAKSGRLTERDYPRAMEMWVGVPTPVNAAFTNFDNQTYFIQGTQSWRLEKNKMAVARDGSSQETRSLWLQCSNAAILCIGPSTNLVLYITILISVSQSINVISGGGTASR